MSQATDRKSDALLKEIVKAVSVQLDEALDDLDEETLVDLLEDVNDGIKATFDSALSKIRERDEENGDDDEEGEEDADQA